MRVKNTPLKGRYGYYFFCDGQGRYQELGRLTGFTIKEWMEESAKARETGDAVGRTKATGTDDNLYFGGEQGGEDVWNSIQYRIRAVLFDQNQNLFIGSQAYRLMNNRRLIEEGRYV